MANVNYMNPEAMYPLQTTQPNSGALGAGTTPGSFLAGFMLPDRLRDYERVFGQSMLAGDLSNQRSEADLRDFLAQGPLKDVQRRRDIGVARNELALQPGALSLAAKRQQGELSRVNTEEGVKLQKALSEMESGERQKTLSELLFASQILNKFKDENGKLIGDPSLISQEMQRYGINVKPEHLQGISRFNPEELKHMQDMEKETFKEVQHTGRTLEEIEGRQKVAEIMAGKQSAAGQKTQREKDLDERARQIFIKAGRKRGLSQEQAEDEADLNIWQVRSKEPVYGQAAAGERETDVVQRTLDILRNDKPTEPQRLPPAARQPEEAKEYNVDEGFDYDQIPKGAVYILDGQKAIKR